jgi:hypothetical protein
MQLPLPAICIENLLDIPHQKKLYCGIFMLLMNEVHEVGYEAHAVSSIERQYMMPTLTAIM